MPIFERIMVAVGNAALCSALSSVAYAQTTSDQTGSIALGAKGGFSADSRTLRTQPQGGPENAFEYTMGAGMASDYIYRGVHSPTISPPSAPSSRQDLAPSMAGLPSQA